MRPIAGLRLQTELWESDNMAIAIIALHVLIYKATDISALSIGFITCSEIIVIGGIFIIIGKDN